MFAVMMPLNVAVGDNFVVSYLEEHRSSLDAAAYDAYRDYPSIYLNLRKHLAYQHRLGSRDELVGIYRMWAAGVWYSCCLALP